VGQPCGHAADTAGGLGRKLGELRAANPDGLVMAEPTPTAPMAATPMWATTAARPAFLYFGEMPPHGIPPLARVVRVGDRAWPLSGVSCLWRLPSELDRRRASQTRGPDGGDHPRRGRSRRIVDPRAAGFSAIRRLASLPDLASPSARPELHDRNALGDQALFLDSSSVGRSAPTPPFSKVSRAVASAASAASRPWARAW
jgi:hypothetical protein